MDGDLWPPLTSPIPPMTSPILLALSFPLTTSPIPPISPFPLVGCRFGNRAPAKKLRTIEQYGNLGADECVALYERCGCEGACSSAKEQECVKMRCQVGFCWRGQGGGGAQGRLQHCQGAGQRNGALPRWDYIVGGREGAGEGVGACRGNRA